MKNILTLEIGFNLTRSGEFYQISGQNETLISNMEWAVPFKGYIFSMRLVSFIADDSYITF